MFSEFRDPERCRALSQTLARDQGKTLRIMEVCGTHTMAVFRYGIRDLLPPTIELISGPGCPVCVTSSGYLDAAWRLASRNDVIIATFGDMLRIPGKQGSLQKARSEGADIRMVYSPLDALKIARENPMKEVVFLSVGFETTTPVVALAVLRAREEGLGNVSFLTANKTMPEALKLLAEDPDADVSGYLYPGHVSSIIGTSVYEELSSKYGVAGVVAGFEPVDILGGILGLVQMLRAGQCEVRNLYGRIVTPEGNPEALRTMNGVFMPVSSWWRGIGKIAYSGLALRPDFAPWDAWSKFDEEMSESDEPSGCRCGEILKGQVKPPECPLFGVCSPANPVGACMVSSEGTCAAYYRYGGYNQ